MRYKNIFFDLDNTLWDFRKNSEITLRKMYKKNRLQSIYSIDFETFYNMYCKKNEELWINFRDNKITKEDLKNRRFQETFNSIGIFNNSLSIEFEMNYLDEIIHYHYLVEGAEEILIYLKEKKYKIHVVSNGFKEVTKNKIVCSKLNNYIDTIISSEEINARKPNPKIFEYSLKKSNAKLKNSIFIGDDWIADVIGAYNFGFTTIFFNSLNENKNLKSNIIEIKYLSELKNII